MTADLLDLEGADAGSRVTVPPVPAPGRLQGAPATTPDVTAGVDVRVLAVGFADLCGFTRSSRSLAEVELVRLLDRFETAAMLALPAAGATVVKLLGDGVLFWAPSADVAVDAATLLVTEAHADARLLPVRAAVGVGRVVVRRGDCFGEVVNRTSRLLDAALPHAVVVDDSVVRACPRRAFRPLGQRHLRDYGPWPVWTPVS